MSTLACTTCAVRWSAPGACWCCGRDGQPAYPMPVGSATVRFPVEEAS